MFAATVETEDVRELSFMCVRREDEAREPELFAVPVDDAVREPPAEELLEGAGSAWVVASVGPDCDLEEIGDRVVVEVCSEAGSEALEARVEDASCERFNVVYLSQLPRPAEEAHALTVAVTGNEV
jgi:threonine dehydrogenase-like Zn-dependent dehydrogenase